jgi:hypothetical protein
MPILPPTNCRKLKIPTKYTIPMKAANRHTMRLFSMVYRVSINPKVNLTLEQRGKMGTEALRDAIRARDLGKKNGN